MANMQQQTTARLLPRRCRAGLTNSILHCEDNAVPKRWYPYPGFCVGSPGMGEAWHQARGQGFHPREDMIFTESYTRHLSVYARPLPSFPHFTLATVSGLQTIDIRFPTMPGLRGSPACVPCCSPGPLHEASARRHPVRLRAFHRPPGLSFQLDIGRWIPARTSPEPASTRSKAPIEMPVMKCWHNVRTVRARVPVRMGVGCPSGRAPPAGGPRSGRIALRPGGQGTGVAPCRGTSLGPKRAHPDQQCGAYEVRPKRAYLLPRPEPSGQAAPVAPPRAAVALHPASRPRSP